jgi:MFS transporter, ACS family, D-galactonate transporter
VSRRFCFTLDLKDDPARIVEHRSWGWKGLANRGNESFTFQSGAIQRRCNPLIRVNAHTDRDIMTAKPDVDENQLSRILFLLALSIFINYLDRGNLSIAAPLLKNEFQLSATQLGVLLSSFFWTYSLVLPLSGWLVDRFDVKWVIAGGFVLWSAATAATGAVHAFGTLLLARLALGAGESVSYPACSTILSRYFPEHQRGFANASIVAGMALGPAVGTLAGGILMSRFGWRPVFLVMGVASLLWLLPWLRWMPKSHRDSPLQSGVFAPSIFQILEQRSAWGTFAGLFCMNYLMYFLLTWLPFYLVHERHFSLAAMAKIAGSAYFLMAVAAMSGGWVSDRCISSGEAPTLVRKTFMVVGQVGAGISLAACVLGGPVLSVVCLLLAAALWGISASNTWAITQTLAGPQAAGKWTGLQNFVGNLAGWIAPVVTGFVVDKTGRFFWAFIIAAVIALFGSLSWIFIVGALRQVDWATRPAYADSR